MILVDFLKEADPLGKAVISVSVCSSQDFYRQWAVLGMAFVTLAVCVGLYVLVYVECLVQRWLRASALLLWICLLALGYAMVFTLQTKDMCAWEQVTGQGILALQDWMLPTSCALAPLLSVGWSLA